MSHPFFRLILLAAFTPSCTSTQDDTDTIRIGLLAPYSGEFAATGSNIERVLLTLVEMINESGGVLDGMKIGLAYGDSHSEIERGVSAARSLFEDESVLALIGPEQSEIIAALQQETPGADWAHVLPGITAGSVVSLDDPRWFRVGPTPDGIGCALAERMYDQGHRNIAIVHGLDRMNSEFSESIGFTLDRYGLVGHAEWKLHPVAGGGQTLTQTVARVRDQNPDAIVLAASTKEGARIAQDLAAGADLSNTEWFLAPDLLNDIFIRNLPPGMLEGAKGLSPSVAYEEDAQGLAEVVQQRFDDTPFEGSYFYYDAMALLILAIESAYRETNLVPDRVTIRDHISRVARPPGERVRWNDLPFALEQLRDGERVDYVGVTGNLTLDENGVIDHRSMQYRQRRIVDGTLEFETYHVCVPVNF